MDFTASRCYAPPISAQPCRCASQLWSRLSAARGRGRLLSPPTGKGQLAARGTRWGATRAAEATDRPQDEGAGAAMLVEAQPASPTPSLSLGGGEAKRRTVLHPSVLRYSETRWRDRAREQVREKEGVPEALSAGRSPDALALASRCSAPARRGGGRRLSMAG